MIPTDTARRSDSVQPRRTFGIRHGRSLILAAAALAVAAALVLFAAIAFVRPASAQETSVYYRHFVEHADGSICTHEPPEATLVATLGRPEDRILTENAPRWQPGDPNIDGNGTFGVELGNFPELAVGDSVFVRFTCLATEQQGVIADQVESIPWSTFPQTLQLTPRALPARPPAPELSIGAEGSRLEWAAAEGTDYDVYRRAGDDTLSSGTPRMVYERIAESVSDDSVTDTTAGGGGHGYMLLPVRGGIRGVPSMEVTDIPLQPQQVGASVWSLQPEQIRVRWEQGAKQTGVSYEVYRHTTSPVPLTPTNLVAEVDTTFYVDGEVQSSAIYYYRVLAVSLNGASSAPSGEAVVVLRRPDVPDGFQVDVYANEGIDHPSGMAWGPDGHLYVSELRSGDILRLEDSDLDGRADTVSVFASGFNMPVGLAWKGDSLYVSSRGRISLVRDVNEDGTADQYEAIVEGWEANWHQNNQIVFDEEGYLYVALGSWQDRTTGPSPYHNSIMRIRPDGGEVEIWATGIRNVYDFAFGPEGQLFGSDNGWQDPSQGDPPEELNHYVRGGDYGFPDYLGAAPPGSGTTDPLITFPSHTAPAGIIYYDGEQFPDEFDEQLYLAFFGPDNHTPAYLGRAYRIVRIELDGTAVIDTARFAGNFYRPVDILQDEEGAMYVADLGNLAQSGHPDTPAEVEGGLIYTITYTGATATEPPASETPSGDDGLGSLDIYPNPFAEATRITYVVPESGHIAIEVFDVLGRSVATLVDERRAAGRHDVSFEPGDLAAGVYYCRLTTAQGARTQTMVVLE